MRFFNTRKKLEQAENRNKIYASLRKEDRDIIQNNQKTIKKLASDGTRRGSSESAKVLRSLRK